MLKSLEGSWCLVLGASSGIGRAIALGLAEEGVHVAGVHFDTAAREDEVARLVEDIRGKGVEARFFNANAASRATRADIVPELAELTGATGGYGSSSTRWPSDRWCRSCRGRAGRSRSADGRSR